jgi:hypothetical protein
MRIPLLTLAILGLLSCGPSVRRDLGSIQQSAITFDDMCHLQDFFESRANSHAQPFQSRDEQSTETMREVRDEAGQMRRVAVGEGTYILSSRTDRIRFRTLLRDEYRRLPTMGITANEAEVRVHAFWWQAGGMRHVRAGTDLEISIGNNSWTLPPHPCVGEFLFGEPAYIMRRCFMESEAARSRGEIPGTCSFRDPSAGEAVVSPTDASTSPDVSAPVDVSLPPDASVSSDAVAMPGDVPNG